MFLAAAAWLGQLPTFVSHPVHHETKKWSVMFKPHSESLTLSLQLTCGRVDKGGLKSAECSDYLYCVLKRSVAEDP